MATYLPLHSHRSIPRFMRWTLRIRGQLAHAPGLVGYALDADLIHRRFWTTSAWTSRAELAAFNHTDPHHHAERTIRPLMGNSAFASWTTTADALPVPRDEVRRRTAEALVARTDHPHH